MSVAVIIPTRRRPLLLARALRSVSAQTHRPHEIIVAIDGPDPQTAALLAGWADTLRVIQTGGAGAGAARNAAAALATADWLAFLDDDDEWLPQKLARQLAAASSNRIVTCRSLVITPGGTELWPRTLYEARIPVDEYLFDRRTAFRGETHAGTSTLLMPRHLFAQTQFSTDRQNEDTALLLQATKCAGATLVMLPDPLVVLHKDDPHSLGSQYDWRDMLRWLDGMGSLVTRRAYSGFCLIYLGSQAARQGDRGAFGLLLWRALTRGSPRLMHVLPFLAFWLVPPGARQRARRLAHRFC